MSVLVQPLLLSLGLTLALECSAGFLLGRRGLDMALIALVNILTNPIVVCTYFVLPEILSVHVGVLVMILEALAVIVEGFIYKKYARNIKRPYVFSLCLNAFSFLSGAGINLAINSLFYG